MAVSDLTAHLRRTLTCLGKAYRFDTPCRSNMICHTSRAVSTSISSSRIYRNSIGDLSAHSTLGSRLFSQPKPVKTAHLSRGLASKAQMKYTKRKKAPVDRFVGLDPSQPRLGFEKVKELETADERVKKIFSLEFGSGNDLREMRKKLSEDQVRDKPDEEDDLAVKIASITEHIRAIAPHVENNKKDTVNKSRMLEMIDRRRKMLKYLRKRNYERFERLLQELSLTWSPPPAYYTRKTKRNTEKKAVTKEAWTKKQVALQEFEERWREEKLLEIAGLKIDLGKELTEEERGILEKHREEAGA